MNLFKKSNSAKFRKPIDMTHEEASQEWVYEIYQSKSLWLNRSLLAILVLSFLLFLSIMSNIILLPLKRDVPFLYAFNNATGEITKLGELEPSKVSSNWELTRYFIIQYVTDRESYDFYNIDRPYQIVWAMSDEASMVRKSYEDQVNSSSQTSPYKIYGKDKYITVQVLSINKLNDDTAEIRFQKTLHDRTSGDNQVANQEAIIKWKYSTPKATQKFLDRDPLGFSVTYYQVSQVTLDNNF